MQIIILLEQCLSKDLEMNLEAGDLQTHHLQELQNINRQNNCLQRMGKLKEEKLRGKLRQKSKSNVALMMIVNQEIKDLANLKNYLKI